MYYLWFSYGGKEGWAPAAYLKKIQDGVTASNQSAESNKASVQGQVEIIGNLMEISNLLNKKPANERHSHTQTDGHSANTYRNSQTDSYTQYSGDEDQTEVNTERDSEDQIKPHMDTSVSDSSRSVSVSDACVSASASELCVSSTVSSFKTKTVPASPAIARVAPQRFHSVENSESQDYFHSFSPFWIFFI